VLREFAAAQRVSRRASRALNQAVVRS